MIESCIAEDDRDWEAELENIEQMDQRAVKPAADPAEILGENFAAHLLDWNDVAVKTREKVMIYMNQWQSQKCVIY